MPQSMSISSGTTPQGYGTFLKSREVDPETGKHKAVIQRSTSCD